MWTLTVALLLASPVHAHDSCCVKGAAAVGGKAVEWIPDPAAKQPDSWDVDEDGPWERPLIQKPVPGRTEVFCKELLDSIVDGCPWLLLGLLCTGLLQGLCPSQEAVRKHLAGNGLPVVAKGAVLGLVSPLCSCGALPLAVGLASAGAAAPAIVSFIVAAQSAGIDSLFFTLGVLGPFAAAARMFAAAVVATATGLAVPASKHIPEHSVKAALDDRSMLARTVEGLREAVTTSFDEVVPSVGFGFMVTSALVALLPPGGLALAAALGGLRGRAAVLLLALPLQFCEHAAVPLAAALQKAGASGGLAFAVLTTLPGMNLSSYGVVASVAGAAGAARVAAALWLTGLVGSFVADWVGIEILQIGHGQGMLPEWYEHASRWIMAAIAISAVLRKLRNVLAPAPASSCCNDKACKSD